MGNLILKKLESFIIQNLFEIFYIHHNLYEFEDFYFLIQITEI